LIHADLISGPVAEKSSDELFALDTTGSEAIKKAYQKTHKPLKADEILARRSAIPGVDSRKRSIAKINDGILEQSQKRQRKWWISRKEVRRIKGSLQGGLQLSIERLNDDASSAFDLWAETTQTVQESLPALDYLEKPKPKVTPPTLQKAPIAMTANGKPVRAVKEPKSGSSYNPSFEDWDDLLTKEGQKEVEAEQKRRQEAEAQAEKAARIAATAAAVDEAAARIDDESAWEGFESGYESSGNLKKKRPERKTQAQRNRIKRRREAEQQAKHAKKMSNQRKQALEIEAAQKALATQSPSKAVALLEDEVQSSSGDDTILRRRRLGTTTIPEKQLEVVLPDELQDSLRRLKPEGNLLNDRFRNLLVNGKLEARKPITQPKKARRTYTEKWTYKDFSVPV
jgi:nucleolar protein 53